VSESIALISAELAQGKNRRALLDWLRYADTRWTAPPKISAPDAPERKRVVRVSLKKSGTIGNRLLLLNNWTHVKADQFIVGRVSSETKARLRALAEKELLSESALLRRLAELVLLKAGLSPILTESPTGARPRRGARLMIRLRPDDQILLRERAAARGTPPATSVSVLTRSHLRSLAPLPAEELLALKRTIGELGSIGRNLNQIARAANQGQLVTSPGRDDLTAMLRVCGTLRDSLKRVLLANLKSWEQGSP
jgi:hypothetical protein